MFVFAVSKKDKTRKRPALNSISRGKHSRAEGTKKIFIKREKKRKGGKEKINLRGGTCSRREGE